MDAVRALKQANIPFYYVGGFVRDHVLKRPSQDIDLVVDCPLEEVYPLIDLKKSIIKGKLLRTMEGEKIEISPLAEGSLERDLGARDFTVNAMAMTKDGRVVDYLGGLEDCHHKILRIVSEENLVADYCRALKGVRQAAELGFAIESETMTLFIKHHSLIQTIAPERIMLELNKIMLLPKPSIALDLMRETGIMAEILPEVAALYRQEHHNPHHHYDIYWHTLYAVDHADIEGLSESEALILRLAALGHDVGKLQVRSVNPKTGFHRFLNHNQASAELFRPVLNKLTYGHSMISRIITLIIEHMRQHELSKMANYKFRKFMYGLGQENVELLLRLFQADTAAKGRENQEEDRKRLQAIRHRMESCKIEPLAITGKEIMEVSTFEGPQVGLVKEYLLDQVLREPRFNKREWLLQKVICLEQEGFAQDKDQ